MLEYLIELKIHIQANYYFQSFCLCCCFTAKDSKIIAGNIDAYNIGPPFPRENEQRPVMSNDRILTLVVANGMTNPPQATSTLILGIIISSIFSEFYKLSKNPTCKLYFTPLTSAPVFCPLRQQTMDMLLGATKVFTSQQLGTFHLVKFS